MNKQVNVVVEDLYLSGSVLSGEPAQLDSKVDKTSPGSYNGAQNSFSWGDCVSAFTDNSIAEGEYTTAGTRSFSVISGDEDYKTWRLKTTSGILPGMCYCMRLLNNYMFVGSVLSVIDSNVISVDRMPSEIQSLRVSERLSDPFLSSYLLDELHMNSHDVQFGIRAHPSDHNANEYAVLIPQPYMVFKDFNFDANTMWFAGHPEIGDISSYSTACHSQGYGTIAQKQYSHAEGEGSIAVGKYSHAEGMATVAGYASHAEGRQTSAYGLYSHAEGQLTLASADVTHADGVKAVAPYKYSYVWNGVQSQTYYGKGDGSFSINPLGEENGFFIGEKNLNEVIQSTIDDNIDSQAIDQALCSGIDFKLIDLDIVFNYHIDSVKTNTSYGKPISAQTSSYYCTYCRVKVQPGDQYEISTRLGSNTCIMYFDKFNSPLNIGDDNPVKGPYQYKRYDIIVPDGCASMTIDNHVLLNSAASVYIPTEVRKKVCTYYNVSEISAAVNQLSTIISSMGPDYQQALQLANSILN